MDSNVEDKMYRQIEKSLSNNINESLFAAGRGYDDKKSVERDNYNADFGAYTDTDKSEGTDREQPEYTGNFPQLSRAEYIRQAREACLRQMNMLPSGGRSIEDYGDFTDPMHSGLPIKKKGKGLFRDGEEEENSPQEIASFRSLIIRTVCAIVLFISIFAIDKLEVKWGDFSYQTVREFVTGKDQMGQLETWIVSWLK